MTLDTHNRQFPITNSGLLGIHMSMCNATSTPYLQNLVKNGELDIGSLVTHRTFGSKRLYGYDS